MNGLWGVFVSVLSRKDDLSIAYITIRSLFLSIVASLLGSTVDIDSGGGTYCYHWTIGWNLNI